MRNLKGEGAGNVAGMMKSLSTIRLGPILGLKALVFKQMSLKISGETVTLIHWHKCDLYKVGSGEYRPPHLSPKVRCLGVKVWGLGAESAMLKAVATTSGSKAVRIQSDFSPQKCMAPWPALDSSHRPNSGVQVDAGTNTLLPAGMGRDQESSPPHGRSASLQMQAYKFLLYCLRSEFTYL